MKLRNAALMFTIVALLVGASLVPNATSRKDGIPVSLGDSVTVNGCNCHGGDASSGVALAMDAPTNLTGGQPYTSVSYTYSPLHTILRVVFPLSLLI